MNVFVAYSRRSEAVTRVNREFGGTDKGFTTNQKKGARMKIKRIDIVSIRVSDQKGGE